MEKPSYHLKDNQIILKNTNRNNEPFLNHKDFYWFLTYVSAFSKIFFKSQTLYFQNFSITVNPETPLTRHLTFIVESSGCWVIFNTSNFTYAYFRWPTVRNSATSFIKWNKPLKNCRYRKYLIQVEYLASFSFSILTLFLFLLYYFHKLNLDDRCCSPMMKQIVLEDFCSGSQIHYSNLLEWVYPKENLSFVWCF